MERSMKKDELISIIRERNPLLADAVSHMVDYVTDKYPAAYPNKEQSEAVNRYLHSVMADGDGTMSRENCEHRRIASQRITINSIRLLDWEQQNRLQDVLDHISYDRNYYLPERGWKMGR